MAEQTKKPQTKDERIDDLAHACAMLVTFPGMREFVGSQIFEEVTELLGPQEPLDVSPLEG